MVATLRQPVERIPPHSVEAEQCVIGSMLLAGDNLDAIEAVKSTLRADSFYQPDHGVYFSTICRMFDRKIPVDAVSVRAELVRAGVYQEVGGVEYNAVLMTTVPSSAHLAHYASIVRENHLLREVIRASERAIQRAFAPSNVDRAAEIAINAVNDLTSLAYTGRSDSIVKLSEAIATVLEKQSSGAPSRIKTGLFELDDLIGGLPLGKFTIAGGRPRIGKSQLAKQIVLNAARNGEPCGIVTIEENREKIGQNYLSNASGVGNSKIAYGTACKEEWDEIFKAVDKLNPLPIYIADDPVKLRDVEAAIRTMVTKYGCKLVVVDYLQLVDSEDESNENREITIVCRTLKACFKRLNVAGLVLCQLNRGNEQNGVRRPTMRDLRGSGSIEQDADLIFLLHREDVYHLGEAGYQPTNQLEILIEKNKDGNSGIVPLHFSGRTQTISDWKGELPAGPF